MIGLTQLKILKRWKKKKKLTSSLQIDTALSIAFMQCCSVVLMHYNDTQIYLGFLFNIYNKINTNMKHLKTPQELNEASENLNISDVSRGFSIHDLQRAFEEGYKLYNQEGNKYMGFEVMKIKKNMIQRAFNKFFDENYD